MGFVLTVSFLGVVALVILSAMVGITMEATRRRDEAERAAERWRRRAEKCWLRDPSTVDQDEPPAGA